MNQTMRALELANEVRLASARVRRELQALDSERSRARAVELLRDPSPEVSRMRVGHFLTGIRRFSRVRSMRYLNALNLGLAWDRRIGPLERKDDTFRALSDRQRRCLADQLEQGL